MKRQILFGSLVLIFWSSLVHAGNLPEKSFKLTEDFVPYVSSEKKENLLYKSDEVIVCFKEGAVRSAGGPMMKGPLSRRGIKSAIANSIVPGAAAYRELQHVVPNLLLVKLPKGKKMTEALMQFSQSPDVLYVEPNYRIELCETPFTKQDGYYTQQWALNNTGNPFLSHTPGADIDAYRAWGIETGVVPDVCDSNLPGPADPCGFVVVAVADTGIDYKHPDLRRNMWFNKGEDPKDPNNIAGVDNDYNGGYQNDVYGYNFAGTTGNDHYPIGGNGDPMDKHYHGTHVAGIIGAVGNNGIGISGVCWDVKLMALKIFGDDYGGTLTSTQEGNFVFDAAAAIDYAVNHNMIRATGAFPHLKDSGTVKVINASWGLSFSGYSRTLENAIQRAGAYGILFVAAAGNSGQGQAEYPASSTLNNVISVMATDSDDHIATNSNWGATDVHLAAPGGDNVNYGQSGEILSTLPIVATASMTSHTPPLPASYGYLSGTSAAAPHVSGAAALMWSLDPTLTVQDVKAILTHPYCVDHLTVLEGRCVSEGRLNVYNALRMVQAKNHNGGKVKNINTSIQYNSIQEAIDASSTLSGHTLIVDSGWWYFENINLGVKNLKIRSSNINDPNTFISSLFHSGHDVVTFSGGQNALCILEGFTITDGGRGVYCTNSSSPTIKNCRISRNNGGGIRCDSGSSPTINGCELSINRNGAIRCSGGSNATITNCTIQRNTNTLGGGGIRCESSSSAKVINSTIDKNTTTTSSSSDGGGGIYAAGGSAAKVTGCTITNNNSPSSRGGGIYSVISSIDVNGCTISNNSSSKRGGGIYCTGASLPKIFDCQINGNTSGTDSGGGIYCNSSANANIISCTIRNNTALVDGGGIGCYNSSPTIKNCLIINNIVNSWDGGGIALDDSSPTIINCTIAGNSSNITQGLGGGVYCYDLTNPNITNCIISGNRNCGIGFETSGIPAPVVRNCLFFDNGGGDYSVLDDSSGETVVYTGEDALNDLLDPTGRTILYGNPLFVRGQLGNYYLSSYQAGQIIDANGNVLGWDPSVSAGDVNSPAINAGSDTAAHLKLGAAVNPGERSYSTRTDNVADKGIVDIGYHYYDPHTAVVYHLNTEVIGNGSISPASNNYVQYSQVLLIAEATDNEYQFLKWHGTDDDSKLAIYDPNFNVARLQYNVVTMSGSKTISAEFETKKVILKMVLLPGETGSIFPRKDKQFNRGEVVTVSATPVNLSHVVRWLGTDDDTSVLQTNTVTMVPPFTTDDEGRDVKEVDVRFYAPQTLTVGANGRYGSIQQAIDVAQTGDEIILLQPPDGKPYYTQMGFSVYSNITIRSSNPDDPCCVAATVIEQRFVGGGALVGPAFTFSNVGSSAVLNGITIRGFHAGPTPTLPSPPNPTTDGYYDGLHGFPRYGRGISCWWNASPIIKNCVITDCNLVGDTAANGAGGDTKHGQGGNGGFPGGAYGAGMTCMGSSNPTVINCTFRNCHVRGGAGGDGGSAAVGFAGGRGGGFYYDDWMNINWDHGYILYPAQYTGAGGAVYVGSNCSPTFINCTFDNNRSEGGHNGLTAPDNPSGRIHEPTIRYRIKNLGGAVYCDARSRPQFTRCAFNDNIADANDVNDPSNDAFVSWGGAVAFDVNANPLFEDCTFNGNSAVVGGAIYSNKSNILISGSSFLDNIGYNGGGVVLLGGESKISRSNFEGNRASKAGGLGGAIASHGANTLISDCSIVGNASDGSGGGIFISNKDVYGHAVAEGERVLVKNCLIASNTAARDGGGISANWYSDPNISNCTIADNTVTGIGYLGAWGGGVYSSYGSYTRIINSILWGNSAEKGKQIATGTSFKFDPRPSTVEVAYSDVQDGASGIYCDTGDPNTSSDNSVVIWKLNMGNLTGTPYSNPLFVSIPSGDYYLSQPYVKPTDPGQLKLSPCVNKGSGDANAPNINLYRHTTRTDRVIDGADPSASPNDHIVDMGYHYLLKAEILGDFNFDGAVDLADFKIFYSFWLDSGCTFPEWCKGTDLNKDGIVNFRDEAMFKKNYGEGEKIAPMPNPPIWATIPYSDTVSSISMTASKEVDNTTRIVLYYFQRVLSSGEVDTSFVGSWRTTRTFKDTGLVKDAEYGYRVRATDYKYKDPLDPSKMLDPNSPSAPFNVHNPEDAHIGNKTGWSVIGYAIVGEAGGGPPPGDSTPPVPSPMLWATAPHATSSSTIAMIAVTASDPSGPVQYYFEETSGNPGGSNSGWTNNSSWTDTGLTASTQYTYHVKARDGSANRNETGWSALRSATTLASGGPPTEDANAPIPNPSQWEVTPKKVYGGGGSFDYYADMTAVAATDTSGVEYKFVCNDSRFSSGGAGDPNGIVWRNETNVSGDPRVYRVRIGQPSYNVNFYVIVRDRSPRQNATGPSVTLPWSY